jgi:hypothetical protein
LTSTSGASSSLRAHYNKERFLMGKGNKKQVTIGHNPSFSPISKGTIYPTSFLTFFQILYQEPVLEEMSFFLRKSMDYFLKLRFHRVSTFL